MAQLKYFIATFFYTKVTTPPASQVAPGFQGMNSGFIAFPDGAIDVTLHKIDDGISA